MRIRTVYFSRSRISDSKCELADNGTACHRARFRPLSNRAQASRRSWLGDSNAICRTYDTGEHISGMLKRLELRGSRVIRPSNYHCELSDAYDGSYHYCLFCFLFQLSVGIRNTSNCDLNHRRLERRRRRETNVEGDIEELLSPRRIIAHR